MNHRKILGTFAGLVVLAGISYHQVRDAGPDPRDTAIMSGTIIAGEETERVVDAPQRDMSCDPSRNNGEDAPEGGSESTCREGHR